jgi:anti-sigma B factor antagonist
VAGRESGCGSDKAGSILDETDAGKNGNWRVTVGDAPGVVVMAGEIDFSVTPQVRERLLELVGETDADILLDMAGLDYIDSSGLAMLLELRKHLQDSGRSVRVRSISPQVRKLFNLTQLSELFGLPE